MGDCNTRIFTACDFLLTELKAEDSLPVVLDVLKQDDEFLEFWFEDFLTETIWECLYVLGRRKLDVLKSFMMEPDHYCFARSEISTAVSQIALHEPERRAEIIHWFKELLEFLISEKKNDRIIDTDLNGSIAIDLLDMNATELEPLIVELYQNNLASEFHAGNLNEVLRELHRHPIRSHKRELPSMYSRYEKIIDKWDYNNNDPDEFYVEPQKPIVNVFPKIGRNDPCHCGSGLKYKKCHGR